MKWLIASVGFAGLLGCGSASSRPAIDRYRMEIENGFARAFAGGDGVEPKKAPFIEHYVSPDGKPTSDGTMAQPWDLATALRHPKKVKPGDVIWLREGRYRGLFKSTLIGQKGAPVVVRQYPGERAILEGCSDPPSLDPTLLVEGEYTWYWGFEVTHCEVPRVMKDTQSTAMGGGVDLKGTDAKLINLVIHDTGGGVGAWVPAKRAELAGNIIYYNGFDSPDRGHGHGIYVQNEHGPKRLVNNIVFSQYGSGIHAYGEKALVTNLDMEGNIVFANGALSQKSGYSRNFLIGGHKTADGILLRANRTYYPLTGGGANMIGYDAGCTASTLQDNYFAGPDSMTVNECKELRMQGNSFVGSKPVGVALFQHPANVITTKPTGHFTDLRLDPWEPGRAYLTVYNWDRKPSILVEITEVGWKRGQKYRMRSVENYFAEGRRGEFSGELLQVPLEGWTVAQPLGAPAPPSMLPEFGVFVLEMDDAK